MSHQRRDGPSPETESTDPQWFREPNPREHRIAAGLFIGFGLFFAMLFWVQRGWWFRWIILALAVVSIAYALWHWRDARRGRQPMK